MTIPAPEASAAAAAYPGANQTERLRVGHLRFFRTIAESVGAQGPTAGVVIAAAVLASISGGGTALVQIVAAVAMGFLVVVAAIVFTIRQRMSPVKTVILLIGLAVLGYVVKATFIPIPAAPFGWDALAAAITLVTGILLPSIYPPLRRGIENSPLLRAGASALLGIRGGN